jgi:hypothetical protein
MSRSTYKNIYEGYLDNTGYNNRNIRERYGSCGSEPMPYEMNEKPVMENYNWWRWLTKAGALNTANLNLAPAQQPTTSTTTASQPTTSTTTASQATASKTTTTTTPPPTTTTTPICGMSRNICECGSEPKQTFGGCDICTIPLTKNEPNNALKSTSSYSGVPTVGVAAKDGTTYQLCKSSDSSGWFSTTCNGKHLCNNKYIYADTDVDGLTRRTIASIPNVNICYAHLSTDKEAAGIVYNRTTQNCYIINAIPGMSPEKLSVTWAYQKSATKPYHNADSVLILKKT